MRLLTESSNRYIRKLSRILDGCLFLGNLRYRVSANVVISFAILRAEPSESEADCVPLEVCRAMDATTMYTFTFILYMRPLTVDVKI